MNTQGPRSARRASSRQIYEGTSGSIDVQTRSGRHTRTVRQNTPRSLAISSFVQHEVLSSKMEAAGHRHLTTTSHPQAIRPASHQRCSSAYHFHPLPAAAAVHHSQLQSTNGSSTTCVCARKHKWCTNTSTVANAGHRQLPDIRLEVRVHERCE